MQLSLVRKKQLQPNSVCLLPKTQDQGLLPSQDLGFCCHGDQVQWGAKERQGHPDRCCYLPISLGHKGYDGNGAHSIARLPSPCLHWAQTEK